MERVKKYWCGALIMAFIFGFFLSEVLRDFLFCWDNYFICLIKTGFDTLITVVAFILIFKLYNKHMDAVRSE